MNRGRIPCKRRVFKSDHIWRPGSKTDSNHRRSQVQPVIMATTTHPRINHSLELSRLYPSCYPCFKGARRCSSTDNQGARPCDRCVKDGLPPEECVAHQDDPRWVAGKSGATKRRDGGKGGRDNAYDGGVRAATTEGLRRSARSTRFVSRSTMRTQRALKRKTTKRPWWSRAQRTELQRRTLAMRQMLSLARRLLLRKICLHPQRAMPCHSANSLWRTADVASK